MKAKYMMIMVVLVLALCGCNNQDKANADEEPKQSQEQSGTQPAEEVTLEATLTKVDDSTLKAETKATGENLTYAFYIIKGTEVVKKFMYQKDPFVEYEVTEPGSYKVQAYVKSNKGEKVIKHKYTDIVEFAGKE